LVGSVYIAVAVAAVLAASIARSERDTCIRLRLPFSLELWIGCAVLVA
jgi:hypothetical protein